MVKIKNAALQVVTIKGEEFLILRGVIDCSTINNILTDKYQREVLENSKSNKKIRNLAKAIKESSVPDVELGMRGDKYKANADGTEYTLLDNVYIIDGLQRISGARLLMNEEPDARPEIGCVVHFGTTFQWELERFEHLNQDRTAVSPNILLRNKQEASETIRTLRRISAPGYSHLLADRVCWNQKKRSTDYVEAAVLLKIAGCIHNRFGMSVNSSTNNMHVLEMVDGMLAQKKIGLNSFRENVKDFFIILDDCYQIHMLSLASSLRSAVFLKRTFMLAIASIIMRYDDFWPAGDRDATTARIHMPREVKTKLKNFPGLSDPIFVAQCNTLGYGTVNYIMKDLVAWINKNRPKDKRLKLNPMFDEHDAPDDVEME